MAASARPLTKSQLVLLLHVQANGVLLVGTFRPALVARYGLLARSGLLTEQEQHCEFRRFSLSPCGEETLKQTPEAVLMDAHAELLAAELRDILRCLQRERRARRGSVHHALLEAVRDGQRLAAQREALLDLCALRCQERNARLEAEHAARQALQPPPAQQGEEA